MMRNHWLKKLRVILSLFFFVVISALFLDFTEKAVKSVLHAVVHFQFIPSILQFIATLAPLAMGFVIIILLTLLFGRVYCSTLCPLGTLQDIFHFMNRKLAPRRKGFKFKKPMNWLRYGITGLVILSLLTGSILMLNILDPFSAFGKISHNMFRPLFILGNNIAAKTLNSHGHYFLLPEQWISVNKAALALALAWTLLLVILAVTRGRLYCNTVCPVGTVLGILSRASLYRISLDQSVCNSCGKCSAVCKAECIDPKKQELDFSRCVGCMNCLSPCPDGGVHFVFAWNMKKTGMESPDFSKRKFLKETGLALTGSVIAGPVALAQNNGKKEVIKASVPVIREHPVTPPGSLGQARFNSLCTACHLCVSACPTHVLQPSYFSYGLNGFLQPRMDYITSFCNFECTLCGDVCPTGAILPLKRVDKQLIQLGKAHFVKENCIVYTDHTDCGACSEHCPTKAVDMVPYLGRLRIPEVTENICIGCGACEYACPTDPKSIYVEGNPVHLQADKPEEEALEGEIDYQEDFPF